MFWMLAAFVCCQRIFERGRWQDYLLAGLLTGVAAATKYNGLGVGVAIPAAHFARLALERDVRSFMAHAFAPKLVARELCRRLRSRQPLLGARLHLHGDFTCRW
jgi:hypothetical protein